VRGDLIQEEYFKGEKLRFPRVTIIAKEILFWDKWSKVEIFEANSKPREKRPPKNAQESIFPREPSPDYPL
jgi:hypothetical protein